MHRQNNVSPLRVAVKNAQERSEIDADFRRCNDDLDVWNSDASLACLKKAVALLDKQKKEMEDIARQAEGPLKENAQDQIWLNHKIRCERELERITEHQKRYKFSLLERILALQPKARAQLRRDSNMGRFINAYVALSDASFIQRLPFQNLFNIANFTYESGEKHSAARGLAMLVVDEVVRRIDANCIYASQIKLIAKTPLLVETGCDQILNKEVYNHLTAPLVNAFRQIYKALRDGQSGWFKTNFLAGKENLSVDDMLDKIKTHSQKNPESRTAYAWRLAQKHFHDCSNANTVLFTAIYKYSFAHSGSFFKKSNVTGLTFFSGTTFKRQVDQLTAEQIAQHSQAAANSRTAKIYRALGGVAR